jgi:hypothetical protein
MEYNIREDRTVQRLARLYAILNDWYTLIPQEKRGVRNCERIDRIISDGLIPLSQRYVTAVSDGGSIDAQVLLEDMESENRPEYVAESHSVVWDDYNRYLQRILLDPEIRVSGFAIETAIHINEETINLFESERFSSDTVSEFEEIWSDWYDRLSDLYWERRFRLAKEIVQEMEQGILEKEDTMWEMKKERYPEFPSNSYITGEKRS